MSLQNGPRAATWSRREPEDDRAYDEMLRSIAADEFADTIRRSAALRAEARALCAQARRTRALAQSVAGGRPR